MKCPFCQDPDSRVVDSRVISDGVTIRRRRECGKCNQRFTTYERLAETHITVVKKDDSRVPFDRSRIIAGVTKACYKRPISQENIEKLSADIETELVRSGDLEIASHKVGEMVMARLKDLDKVAYVRFASVYRNFTDVSDFENVIESIASEPSKSVKPSDND